MGKIEPIEDVECRREIRNIGKRLFKSQDIREMVFKPEVEACLMFCPPNPDDRDHLTKDQYEAIISAAKLILADWRGQTICSTRKRLNLQSQLSFCELAGRPSTARAPKRHQPCRA